MSVGAPDTPQAPPAENAGQSLAAAALAASQEAEAVAVEARAVASEAGAYAPADLASLAQALESSDALCRALLQDAAAQAQGQTLIQQIQSDLARLAGALRTQLASAADAPADPAPSKS